MKNARGFTLIEVLVAISVMGNATKMPTNHSANPAALTAAITAKKPEVRQKTPRTE